MSAARPALALAALVAVGCASPLDARQDEIASVFADADLALIRTRPLLVAGKYRLMASDPFSFYRGNLPLFLHDWEKGAFGLATSKFTSTTDPEPLAVGDPHPENFGLLLAANGTFALEPNDFDSADRAPYLWDVRRFVVGLAIAAQLANSDDVKAERVSAAAARDVARAGALGYAQEIAALARGDARPNFDHDEGSTVIAHLFEKEAEDLAARQELVDDTILDGTTRRLRRGVLSADEPTSAFEDASPDAVAALPALLDAYRSTLLSPPPARDLEILDVVREFGSGVASWPRVRLIVLVRGATDAPDDDFLLEVKELADAALLPRSPPDVAFDSVDDRVLETSRHAWFSPSSAPLWGTSTLLGLPVQVRLESAAQHTLRVAKLTGDRGTPEALEAMATILGRLVARVHASPLAAGEAPARDIASAIHGEETGFADEQADVAIAYAAQVLADRVKFAHALTVLGPSLGVPSDPGDAPPPDLAELYGTPPEARDGGTP